MFCEKCGHNNPEGSPFCGACGAPMNSQPAPQPAAQPVYVAPPVGNPLLKKKRKVALSSWIFMLINAVLGLTAILMPLIPFGYEAENVGNNYYSYSTSRAIMWDKHDVNIFNERNSWLSLKSSFDSENLKAIGVFLAVVLGLSAVAILAGIVLAIFKKRASAFCILGGTLYPFLYSYELIRLTINRNVVNAGYEPSRHDRYDWGYNAVPYIFICVCILAIVSSALALYKYRTEE